MFLCFNLWFFSVYQNSIIKNNENRVLRIFENLLFRDSWKWGKWAIYKFIHLEILFLLIYDTQAKDIAVVKSGTINDFWSSRLYDSLNKLSPWHTFSNMAKIRSTWLTFSNMAKIRYYFLQTIIKNRNQRKTTEGVFLPEVQNLFVGKFFAGCVMVTSLFSMLFKCV